MPTYEISVGGKVYEVSSQQPLTDAQAYAAAQSQIPKPEKVYRGEQISQEELTRRAAKMAAEDMPGWQQGIVNLGAGMMKPIRGIGQMLGMVDQGDVDEARIRDKALAEATPGGGFGQFVGEAVPAALAGGGLGAGVTRGAQAVSSVLPRAAGVLGNKFAQAAATGGLQSGLTQEVGTGETRLGQAAQGAAFGLGGQAIGSAAGRTLTGLVKPSAQAQALMQRGIVPTIGQGADDATRVGASLKRFEESAQSVPIVGDIITGARKRATREAVDDIVRQTLPPGANPNVLVGRQGNKSIEAVADAYNDAYAKVLAGTKVKPDFKTISDVRNVVNDPSIGLTPSQRRAVTRYMDETVGDKVIDKATGRLKDIDGETFKKIQSDLGTQARKWAGSASTQERSMGEAYKQIGDVWRGMHSPANVGAAKSAALDAIDAQYAKFARVREAAGSAGAAAKEGEFTPRQLLGAIRKLEPRKGKFAAGESLLQEEAGQMARVLGAATPDSGTPTRMLTNALLLGPAAAFGMLPAVAKGAAIGGLTYTRPMQKALLGGYNKQRQMQQAFKQFQKQYPGVAAGIGQSIQGE